MDVAGCPSAAICKSCGEAFNIPEDKVDGNLPRLLFCGHFFCTFCLVSFQSDGVIRCPDCEVESTVPDGGVCGLQEETRIIGLIYTTKTNKTKGLHFDKSKYSRKNELSSCGDPNMMDTETEQPADEKIKKVVDEALDQSTGNLAQLELIHETLKAGLAEQVKKERTRLELEINQATDRASQAILKWKDMQLDQLTKLEEQFSRSEAVVSQVQERIKTLEIAMRMAREVRRVPFLGRFCILDKVLEELQAPVDNDSFDVKSITMDSEMSCVFRSESVSRSLTLSLKMEPPTPKRLTGSSAKDYQLEGSTRNCHWTNAEGRGSSSTQWVAVTHIVNPSHFYVRYVAERRERETLSKKINQLCLGDGCLFVKGDTVKDGYLIFAKWKGEMWCRTRVIKIFQQGCEEPVKDCPVTALASLRVFFPDFGYTKTITIKSEASTAESTLKAVNKHLRKADKAVTAKLGSVAPQAIRCALKDLVPYDPSKGWSKEAEVEFHKVVDAAALEMRPLGQDKDSLFVDLRKAPMDQSTDVAISIREFLVFMELARFYSPVTPTMRPLMYYPPIYPKNNAEVNAVVSHINSPSDFYIQLVDNMESLLLSAKLQDCYNAPTSSREDELTVYCPVLGQACIALFEDVWYRAKVIAHPGGTKVEVQYVDFGNNKIVSVSDLRKIKDEFFALPAKAIHCCLVDVLPASGDTWSETCTNKFISLAHHQLVTIVATGIASNTEPLPIKVLKRGSNESEENIAELLVKEDLGCFKAGLEHKNPKPSGEDSAIWDSPLELALASEGVDAQDQIGSGDQNDESRELRLQLKDLNVRVSHVSSPSSFYVQFPQYDAQFKRMCERVKQECALMEPQDVVWKADMYCAAHINGVWERGRICSDVTSSNLAEVRRCDHGDKAKLHVSDLRPLPASLIGSLALECTLSDIRPTGGRSTWTDTACDFISFYLTRASAVITIKELTDPIPVPVTLFFAIKKGQFINIADLLVKEGLALRERRPKDAGVQEPENSDLQTPARKTKTNSKKEKTTCPAVSLGPFCSSASLVSSSRLPIPRPRSIITPEKVFTQLYQPPELPCLGPIHVNVSTVGEDGLIYIRAQDAEDQLEQLKELIQQNMKTLPRQKPFTWKSVQGCAVIGPDMLWYRGQLLEVLGGHVKVQYVDYGLVENIPVVHVYPMLLCMDVPQLCMPCQLLGTHPVGGKWQRDAVALMKELLLNCPLDMQVVELPADPRGPLTVEVFLDGLSLSSILCQHEHATVDRTVTAQKGLTVKTPEPVLDDWNINTEGVRSREEPPLLGPFIYPNLPQEGEEFKVLVKHLRTPNELFLWPLVETANVEVDGETLDEALTRINADIDTLPLLTSFPFGGPCLVEYSDGTFYRARLQKFHSTEPVMILVQHVDFGSNDIVPTSKLRQMPAGLLQFPCQALKVKVAGFKPPTINQHEDVLPYSPGWSLKAVSEMIDLLHGNITAAVVAREPELTVLLYSEDGELVHLSLVESGLAELD
ncbi:RING finger protein 17 [Cololabis saira]|uniref:RING finger protein 17 n=1 Tax=Cololabis saira TaxID=129043 RepID=UPI002AD4AD6F|nr:RING finger protein 17 [Cololabis saira]